MADGVTDKYPILLDPTDGSIYVRGQLDREQESEFSFQVVARDGSSNVSRTSNDDDFGANESRTNVTVLVLDANDNAPVFYGYTRLRRKEGADLNDQHAVMPIYTAEVRIIFVLKWVAKCLGMFWCKMIHSPQPCLLAFH